MALLIITLLFLLLYALLIAFYQRGWRAAKDTSFTGARPEALLTVVVPARNEEKNIARLLIALQRQSYPKDRFEVLVVDDFSTDNTAGVVRACGMLAVCLLQPEGDPASSSKKKAIARAVKAAKGELIVCTDADCIPSPDWLQVVNACYQATGAQFIAAPVQFLHNDSVLQEFQAIDFLTLQGITAASAATGFHTMCNGANLAYTKKAFEEVDGFSGIDKVATGDDMLLMYKIWKRYPQGVRYLKSRDAIIKTPPMLSWRDFVMQRRRWASKTLVYDDYRIIAVLGFIYLFNCLFFVLIGAAVLHPVYWWYVLGFWVLKTVIEWSFVSSVARFYNEQRLMRSFALFQPLHMAYTVVVGFISQFGKYEWKGRRTR